MRTLRAVVVLALVLGTAAFWGIARLDVEPAAETVPLSAAKPERVLAIFVDSLSNRVARDERTMPALARLARRGATFDVDPCRDQLTFLCLEAAFTGRDESSLVNVQANFDRSRRTDRWTLFDEAKRRGKRIVAVGSHDFSPYEGAFQEARYVPFAEETAETILERWSALERAAHPDVALVGLGSGDLAAHVYGPGSPEYRAAFSNVDHVIDELVRNVPADVHVVVFGDHGHDEKGRHLPGGPGTTFATFTGSAFAPGAPGRLAITDLRVVFGVLLGVPTPRVYHGPALDRVFAPAWLRSRFTHGLPDLRGRASAAGNGREAPWFVIGVCAAALTVLALAFWVHFPRARWTWGAAAILATIAALSGASYDLIRRAVHDHGDSPERSFYLLAPVVVGFGCAALLRRTGVLRAALPGAWLPTGAAVSLVAALLLLFPSPNFYGSSRAVVYLAIAMVVVLVADTRNEMPAAHDLRLAVRAAMVLVVATLSTFCHVDRIVGPAGATYVLKAALYAGHASVALVFGKVIVFALLYPTARSRPLDLAGSASLLTASVFVQLAGAKIPGAYYAALAAVLVVTSRAARRAPMTHLSGGLLLLNHFYRSTPTEVAPMEVLLSSVAAALFAWNNTKMARDSRTLASGLTLTTGAYLLLWPALGFHLSGIDFQFMFEWVKPEDYERLWWVIAIGALVKLALPYALLFQVAQSAGPPAGARPIVATALSAKVALLSVLAVAYAADHSMRSNVGTEILGELCLVSLVLLFAVPFAVAREKGWVGGACTASAMSAELPARY